MRPRLIPLALSVLLFAACGGSDHALAGNWLQDTGSDAKGMSIEFDGKGTEVMVHTAPAADGTHDHLHGSYTFDAATKAVTIKAKLLGDGKADTWTGALVGDRLELSSADGKLAFQKGGKPYGH